MDSVADTAHVACPACGAINRLPRVRLAEHPNCGRCKTALFQGRPLTLTGADFDRHASRSDVPLVIDFWAEWCAPCRAMAPVVDQAARELEPEVRIAKIDSDAEQALAARFGIRSIPTLVVMRGGREIARTSGAMDRDRFIGWVRAALE